MTPQEINLCNLRVQEKETKHILNIRNDKLGFNVAFIDPYLEARNKVLIKRSSLRNVNNYRAITVIKSSMPYSFIGYRRCK